MNTEYQIDMVCCTSTICDEVKAGLSQKDIALSYALALRSKMRGADNPDWHVINTAILSRWKMSGLERIKKRAQDILAGKAKLDYSGGVEDDDWKHAHQFELRRGKSDDLS